MSILARWVFALLALFCHLGNHVFVLCFWLMWGLGFDAWLSHIAIQICLPACWSKPASAVWVWAVGTAWRSVCLLTRACVVASSCWRQREHFVRSHSTSMLRSLSESEDKVLSTRAKRQTMDFSLLSAPSFSHLATHSKKTAQVFHHLAQSSHCFPLSSSSEQLCVCVYACGFKTPYLLS